MSDERLRKLRREFDAGGYPSGTALVVELLRSGLHEQLGAPALKSWHSAWEYHEGDMKALGSACERDEDGEMRGRWSDEGPAILPPLTLLAGTNGLNDGASDTSWTWIGKTHDGRWFFVSGGCDYTGWDCQSSVSVHVLDDLDGLLMLLDTDSVRMLLDGRAPSTGPEGGP